MKFIYLFSAVALIFTMGCNNPTEGETKVVETTKVVEVPAAEVEEKKATKISVGKDGGSIETEDVEIKINE